MNEQIIIRELTPSRLEDYLAFFDQDAFADNPDWAPCYCFFYLADNREKPWDQRSAAENRTDVSRLIAAGRLHGYLAYLEGKPVGWCHAAPKAAFPGLRDEGRQEDSPEQLGAIVCFVIAKPYRRLGVARRLLDAACQGFARQGMKVIEAYPRIGVLDDAPNYHGPLQMYLEAGFEPYRDFGNYMIVRKTMVLQGE
jgi:GNAT superfamily N-acetyltransferase